MKNGDILLPAELTYSAHNKFKHFHKWFTIPNFNAAILYLTSNFLNRKLSYRSTLLPA